MELQQPRKRKRNKIAASTSSNEVQEYCKLVPFTVPVSTTYKLAYVDKHKVANPSLTIDMLRVKYIVLKCAQAIGNQDDYDEHCKMLHIMHTLALPREEITKVDPKAVFKLCQALDIEKLWDEEHEGILTQWYNSCISSAVVTKSTNRSNSDMVSNRSKEFIDEAKQATSKAYYDKFTHIFRQKVNGSLDYSFTCKWSSVEEAFKVRNM